jgi:hypothetical protein
VKIREVGKKARFELLEKMKYADFLSFVVTYNQTALSL